MSGASLTGMASALFSPGVDVHDHPKAHCPSKRSDDHNVAWRPTSPSSLRLQDRRVAFPLFRSRGRVENEGKGDGNHDNAMIALS